LSGWFLASLTGQNHVSVETVDLTHASVSDSANYHLVFSTLSVNNEKNINSLHLAVSFKQYIENTSREVKISWQDVSLSGDRFFRDFAFDSLLIPDRALVTITWPLEGEKQMLKQQFLVSFPATNLLFALRGYHGDGATVQIDFDLSKAKYQRFVDATVVANHYYGFHSVLTNILNNKNKEPDEVAVKYLEVYRALYQIEKLQLVTRLQLKKQDPEKLLLLLAKARRYKTREKTLSFKKLDQGITDDGVDDMAKKLSGLSVIYLSDQGKYQPFKASSYQQMARLVHNDETDAFYQKLCGSATPQNRGDVNLCQKVFDEFLAQANLYRRVEQYPFAMIMLDNAALWTEMAPGVIDEPAFSAQLNGVLDGMMTSYLKVVAASYRVGNRLMGTRYITKADNLYQNITASHRGKVSSSLPLFQSTLVQLGQSEVTSRNFQAMLDLFFRFRYLNYTSQQQKAIFNLKSVAYQRLYYQYIHSAQTALDNGYIDEALRRMQTVKNYRQLRKEFVAGNNQADGQIEKIAYGLILEFIQQGEMLMDQGKHDEAMDHFSTALELQNDFLPYRIKRLDDLMNQTAIPVILHEIEKAKLEVWSNKMEEARAHYQKIIDFQKKYFLEQNSDVSTNVNELKEMLGNRDCVDAVYSLKNYLEVLQNRIRASKWQEALETMNSAQKLVHSHQHCPLDTLMVVGLQYRYRFAFDYVARYEKVKADLFAGGYEKVWDRLAALDAYYIDHKLDLLGVTSPGQYQILKSQRSAKNVERVVRYYLSDDNSLQAYRYLLLLKTFGLTQRETKSLQVATGRKMAAQLSPEKFSNMVDGNDDWLQPLIKTYQTAKR